MKFNNKTAVVTGSASGMGRETAILFAKEGYTVICTDIDKVLLDKTVSDIKKFEGSVHGIAADITKVDDIKNLADEIEKKFSRINVLVNCAGAFVSIDKLVDHKEEDMDLIIDINLKGTYRCCKYLIPIMLKHNNSIIINIGSQSGKLPQPTASIYAAAKAAVINFTKSLELELKEDGIKVVVINPGSTSTAFHGKRDVKLDNEFLAKFLSPVDIAQACLFVAEQSVKCIVKEIDVIPVSEKVVVEFE